MALKVNSYLIIHSNHESSHFGKGSHFSVHESIRGAVPVDSPYFTLHADNYDSFQNEAINMLTHYLLQVMRSLAAKVFAILKMQGRTLPNSLHLLVVAEQLQLVNFKDLLDFITKRKEMAIDMKSL